MCYDFTYFIQKKDKYNPLLQNIKLADVKKNIAQLSPPRLVRMT